jgi:anti-sigma B factor antagonist
MLRTAVRSFGDVVIVDCTGRIVFGEETTSLREQVKDLLNQSRQVVLNLEHVNHIDSNGVGTLVGLHISARGVDGNIKLAGLGGRVRDVLHITKLGTIFEVFETAAEAAASFTEESAVRAFVKRFPPS